MTIRKPVKRSAIDSFMSAAPDAKAEPGDAVTKGVIRGKKRIITLGISPDLCDQVDAAAAALNISRAAWLNAAITRAVKAQQGEG